MSDIWAVIPVKEFDGAKHRLSGLLSPPERRLLAETMLTDVLDAVAEIATGRCFGFGRVLIGEHRRGCDLPTDRNCSHEN